VVGRTINAQAIRLPQKLDRCWRGAWPGLTPWSIASSAITLLSHWLPDSLQLLLVFNGINSTEESSHSDQAAGGVFGDIQMLYNPKRRPSFSNDVSPMPSCHARH
jgi:hypothetical protein